MDEIYSVVEKVFTYVIQYCILLVELIGVCVLLGAIARAIYGMIKRHERLRLDLAEGIALSLEFKMGSELLRTVIVREWNELLILGAVILLRAALTFMIQWEIKTEQKKHSDAHQSAEESKFKSIFDRKKAGDKSKGEIQPLAEEKSDSENK